MAQADQQHTHGGGPCWCGYALDFTKYRREQSESTEPTKSISNVKPGMYSKLR